MHAYILKVMAGCHSGAPEPRGLCGGRAGDTNPPMDGAALISANLTHFIANMTAGVQAGRCSLTHFSSVSPELLPSKINNFGRVEIFLFQG